MNIASCFVACTTHMSRINKLLSYAGEATVYAMHMLSSMKGHSRSCDENNIMYAATPGTLPY